MKPNTAQPGVHVMDHSIGAGHACLPDMRDTHPFGCPSSVVVQHQCISVQIPKAETSDLEPPGWAINHWLCLRVVKSSV